MAPRPARPPRTIWRHADTVERATHQLWQLLLKLVGLGREPAAPAPAPKAYYLGSDVDDQIARAGTTIARLKRERQEAIDARHRPRTAPKREPADPLAATIDAIAERYLGLRLADDWRRARSSETAEAKVAEALAAPNVGVPAAARAAMAHHIVGALDAFARNRYGIDERTGRTNEVPSPYDREFDTDFAEAAEAAGLEFTPDRQNFDARMKAWQAWKDETRTLWRERYGPELITQCQRIIERAREGPPIAPSPAARPTPGPGRGRAPAEQGPKGPALR